MNITSIRPQIHYRGEQLEGFDAVIPPIGASVTFYGTAVLRRFEMMGGFLDQLIRSSATPLGSVRHKPAPGARRQESST
jgi:hypothetical protein